MQLDAGVYDAREWGAEPPLEPLEPFGDIPARYIIIAQCGNTRLCTETAECCAKLREVQRQQIEKSGFIDIGYSFAIGNDNVVYEGRGWKWRPATAKRWNSVSYGVVFLGAFYPDEPHCQSALFNARLLMAHLVENGKLRADFTVYGLRQIRPSGSPHEKLFDEIMKWPEWKEYRTNNAIGCAVDSPTITDTIAVNGVNKDMIHSVAVAFEVVHSDVEKQTLCGNIGRVELQQFYAFLTDRMDVDFGLLDELFAVGVVTERQAEGVKVGKTRRERNEQLLDNLLRHKDNNELLGMFTRSLIKTGQIHLVNYVKKNTKGAELELPLTERELAMLRCNHTALLNTIDPSSALLSSLVAAGCITEAHKEHVNSKSSKHDKNDELLNILRRRSLSSYGHFIGCLRRHNQHQAALVLDGAGAVVTIHVTSRIMQPTNLLRSRSRIPRPVRTNCARQTSQLSGHNSGLEQFEDHISTLLTATANGSDITSLLGRLRNGNIVSLKKRALFADALEKVSTALRRQSISAVDLGPLSLLFSELLSNEMQILFAGRDYSVVVYILCPTKESLVSLWKLMLSGRLRSMISDVWNGLWSWYGKGRLDVDLYMWLEDYTMTRMCLDSLKQFDRLPFEMLELILMRAVAARFIQEVKLTTRGEAIALTAVNSVCWLWWKTINLNDFRKVRRLVNNLCCPYRPHQRHRTTLQSVNGAAIGVALLNNKIFVISLEAEKINVFSHCPPFVHLKELLVKDIYPRDIVTFPPHIDPEHLFIADPYNMCVWQVAENGHAEKFVPNQRVDITFSPWTLSVRSSRLLVTADNHLYVLTPAGDLLSHVPLPESIDAEHAVETSVGTFIVCYNEMAKRDLRATLSPTNLDRVSEVDIHGRVLRSYGGRKGHFPGHLNQPFYLVIDPEGRVVVADYENCRVSLLGSSLKFERVLLTREDELCKPWRLLLVAATGQLVVAMDNGHVNIYDVRT